MVHIWLDEEGKNENYKKIKKTKVERLCVSVLSGFIGRTLKDVRRLIQGWDEGSVQVQWTPDLQTHVLFRFSFSSVCQCSPMILLCSAVLLTDESFSPSDLWLALELWYKRLSPTPPPTSTWKSNCLKGCICSFFEKVCASVLGAVFLFFSAGEFTVYIQGWPRDRYWFNVNDELNGFITAWSP